MKRLMVFVVSLAFLFCASAFAADKKAETKATDPAVAADTAKPEKEKKAEKKEKKVKKAVKKEKKEKKADEKAADAPAK